MSNTAEETREETREETKVEKSQQGEQKKPGQRGKPNYCNEIGFITNKDLTTRTAFANRLEKIATEKGIEEPEATAKLALQLAIPKGHPHYMSSKKACETIYPKKVATQSARSKAGELLLMFVQELLYGVETKDILALKEMEKTKSGPGRKRLEPVEKVSREAAKAVNANFRETKDLQPRGAIPKEMREPHEQFVNDNVENIVKSIYKTHYENKPTEEQVKEMKKNTIEKAL